MEISAKRTKMPNSVNDIQKEIKIKGRKLEIQDKRTKAGYRNNLINGQLLKFRLSILQYSSQCAHQKRLHVIK